MKKGEKRIMKNIEILTCNSIHKDGECIGGYHEIHKINYLQNINHLIATIDSIVKNNLLYGCDNTVLESISVSCSDKYIIDLLNEHYKELCGKVKIEAGFILMP